MRRTNRTLSTQHMIQNEINTIFGGNFEFGRETSEEFGKFH